MPDQITEFQYCLWEPALLNNNVTVAEEIQTDSERAYVGHCQSKTNQYRDTQDVIKSSSGTYSKCWRS